MGKKFKPFLIIILAVELIVLFGLMLQGDNVVVLNPKGLIASQQRDLIVAATLLMLLVVVPVFVLTFFITYKYRETNRKAKYSPDWDSNKLLEFIWWAIPCCIIFILGMITWNSSHSLDPFKPLAAEAKPLKVQVIALDWKWLFIYPEQGVASVNYLQIPINRPIDFEITSDAPMNSFWIPQLGGQIYAMAGMSTQLHLMADQVGAYNGSSANISGRGFAGMHFIVKAGLQSEFDNWIEAASQNRNTLDASSYKQLAEPSQDNPVTVFSTTEPGLYDKIIKKYTSHVSGEHGVSHEDGKHLIEGVGSN